MEEIKSNMAEFERIKEYVYDSFDIVYALVCLISTMKENSIRLIFSSEQKKYYRIIRERITKVRDQQVPIPDELKYTQIMHAPPFVMRALRYRRCMYVKSGILPGQEKSCKNETGGRYFCREHICWFYIAHSELSFHGIIKECAITILQYISPNYNLVKQCIPSKSA